MPDEKIVPAVTNAGETNNGDAHSQTSQLPEQYKGKSAEELAKMHMEAEKKLGEQSNEVSEARKKVDDAMKLQTDAVQARQTLQELTELIYADPERIRTIEGWYAKKGQSADQKPNGQISPTDGSSPSSQTSPQVEDTRRALQDQIFDEFYAKRGIDKLPTKEKQEALQKISSEFADLFDTTGKMSISQIVSQRPLASLRRDLDKAYRLSGIGESPQGDTAQDQNDQAAIGSMSGKTIRESEMKLTAQEEQMAKNLGISPDKYLERKKQIASEKGSVS